MVNESSKTRHEGTKTRRHEAVGHGVTKPRSVESEPGAQATGCNNQQSTIDNLQSKFDSMRLANTWRALEQVFDPEIPVLNVIEMGMIASVSLANGRVIVNLTPTFVGCPALGLIQSEMHTALESINERDAIINVVFDPPWSSDRITETGRRKLKEFGVAPPGGHCSGGTGDSLEQVACPHCDSRNTQVESIFGPTLCRSIHYCNKCLQSFEHFKPV